MLQSAIFTTFSAFFDIVGGHLWMPKNEVIKSWVFIKVFCANSRQNGRKQHSVRIYKFCGTIPKISPIFPNHTLRRPQNSAFKGDLLQSPKAAKMNGNSTLCEAWKQQPHQPQQPEQQQQPHQHSKIVRFFATPPAAYYPHRVGSKKCTKQQL